MDKAMTLEQRIQRLEDIEAIKKLQATYGHYCDKGWNDKDMYYREVASLFTEDATWDSPLMAMHAKGHEEIAQLFADMNESSEFFMHSFSNPIIDIEGDTAKAKWLLYVGGNIDEKTVLTFASYDNVYVRTEAGWRIKAIQLHFARVLEP